MGQTCLQGLTVGPQLLCCGATALALHRKEEQTRLLVAVEARRMLRLLLR
jgi:hypothetical protein